MTGNYWSFQIDKAIARVYLPKGASEKITFMDAFTGPVGSRDKDFILTRGSDAQPIFETTRVLNPGEGLTIVVGWQKGFVSEPTRSQEMRFFIRDNMGILIAVVGLILTTFYYTIVWSMVGKDPDKGTIYPLFEPPPRYSPASIRFISKMGYDDKVFAAALVGLAVKGVIKIIEQPIYIALLVALGVVNYLFYHLLKAPTMVGRRLLDKIEGFKLFLSTAERNRLDMLHPVNSSLETFQRYLPFAIALDVENQWVEKFSDIVNNALNEEDTDGHTSWYSGSVSPDRPIGDMVNSIGDSLSSAVSTSSGSSGSAGSSGGGGSGGGGGW